MPDEPLWVEADRMRLVQILTNLLNNSAKYTKPGGHIWLTVSKDEQVLIRVRDTGIGIPKEMLRHVFELFTQGDWSVDGSQGGMGIGLALVRRLVELHGGSITASSPGLGEGSEFVVRLPLLPEERSEGHDAAQKCNHWKCNVAKPGLHHILVVDDNVDAANTLGMLLKLEGHEV